MYPDIDIIEPQLRKGNFVDELIQQTIKELRAAAHTAAEQAVNDYLKERNISGVTMGIDEKTHRMWFSINLDVFVSDNQ